MIWLPDVAVIEIKPVVWPVSIVAVPISVSETIVVSSKSSSTVDESTMGTDVEDVTVGAVVSRASLFEMGTSVDNGTSDVSNVSTNDDQWRVYVSLTWMIVRRVHFKIANSTEGKQKEECDCAST